MAAEAITGRFRPASSASARVAVAAAGPIGWLLLGWSLLTPVVGVALLYAVLDYRIHRGTLPFGPDPGLLDDHHGPPGEAVPARTRRRASHIRQAFAAASDVT